MDVAEDLILMHAYQALQQLPDTPVPNAATFNANITKTCDLQLRPWFWKPIQASRSTIT
jgi:hypothetical protein